MLTTKNLGVARNQKVTKNGNTGNKMLLMIMKIKYYFSVHESDLTYGQADDWLDHLETRLIRQFPGATVELLVEKGRGETRLEVDPPEHAAFVSTFIRSNFLDWDKYIKKV